MWCLRDMPRLDQIQTSVRTPTIEIRDRHGRLLTRWGALHRVVPLETLPRHLVQALLAVEDRRFFEHKGVDAPGLLRAAWQNVRHRKTVQGASTLTQQLVKNLFLKPERSLKRKVQEACIAWWLEARLSKNQILSLYLNRAFFGRGAWGIEAAARTFFSKPARDLTLCESALLAGLLKAPSGYAPLAAPDKARARAQVVLEAMKAAGFLDPDTPVAMPPVQTLLVDPTPDLKGVRYFTEWIVSQIQEHFGPAHEDLVVITTLDPEIQARTEEAVSFVLQQEKAPDDLQAACLCLDQEGGVRAMVGGRNWWVSPLNRATQTRRQAGSAFKLFVYAAALERGWTPESLISDEPLKLGRWRPRNYKWTSRGSITLQDAFAHSVNTPAVRLTRTCGVPAVAGVARRLGVRSPLPKDLTLALGTASLPVLELGEAFHAVTNGGQSQTPWGILRILTRQGQNPGWTGREPPRPGLSQKVAAVLKTLLAAVVEKGTAKKVRSMIPEDTRDVWLGAKTGTTQVHRDAWIGGVSALPPHSTRGLHPPGHLTTVFWVGFDDGRSLGEVTGGRWPAAMWARFLTNILSYRPALSGAGDCVAKNPGA